MKGFYGKYGGQFVPETLIPALENLEIFFEKSKKNKKFKEDLNYYLKKFAGRPTPLYFAKNLSEKNSMEIYFKREDLLHTGAHKINNTLGQALLAKFMGKKRVIAETGAGQHGVATATVAALFGMECTIYMGKVDIERQCSNVKRMKLLGANVKEVKEGTQTLKDATNYALKDWVANVENTHYIIGSVVGPHPFPEMVAHFQSVIGEECLSFFEKNNFFPHSIVACIGGGSNAIGIFKSFIGKEIELIGVEAGGISDRQGEHARTLGMGKPGILHGSLSYLLHDSDSQVMPVHSVSAGLDYPGVGPEHSYLKDLKRVNYCYVRDIDAINAFKEVASCEGIIPALESSHAIAYVLKNRKKFKNKKVLINLSGRGDKDMEILDSFTCV